MGVYYVIDPATTIELWRLISPESQKKKANILSVNVMNSIFPGRTKEHKGCRGENSSCHNKTTLSITCRIWMQSQFFHSGTRFSDLCFSNIHHTLASPTWPNIVLGRERKLCWMIWLLWWMDHLTACWKTPPSGALSAPQECKESNL